MNEDIAIFCEGKNDKAFFESLIQHFDLNKNNEKQINFYIMGKKSEFFKLDNLKYKNARLEINSRQLKKLLFVIDADYVENDVKYGGYENTKNELNQIIMELGFEQISDVFIMCDPITKIGYLESFILSTIPTEQRKCIEDFLDCSEFKSKENHKAILNQIYKIAYPESPYDFKHSHFDELKEKLRLLFENKEEQIC